MHAAPATMARLLSTKLVPGQHAPGGALHASAAACLPPRSEPGLGPARPSPLHVPPQGGVESLEQLEARAEQALEDLAARHPGQRLLVVTHGGFLSAAYRQGPGPACTG